MKPGTFSYRLAEAADKTGLDVERFLPILNASAKEIDFRAWLNDTNMPSLTWQERYLKKIKDYMEEFHS